MTVFTIRPKNNLNESLSSFLVRVAEVNEVKFLDLLKYIMKPDLKFRLQTGYVYKIDLIPEHYIDIRKLSQLLNVSTEKIKSMTLTNVYNQFIGTGQDVINSSVISHEFERKRRRFCPVCLDKKKLIMIP